MIKIATVTNNPQLINDWVEWHKKFNFDEIVIFNNSPNLFKIDGTSEIDAKDIEAPQLKLYQSYIDQLGLGDWVLFLDDDELLNLEGDVHDFLKPYTNCDTVRLNWKCYGDNGELRYREAPIWERFPEPCDENVVYNDKLPQRNYRKLPRQMFLQTNFQTSTSRNSHTFDSRWMCCEYTNGTSNCE